MENPEHAYTEEIRLRLAAFTYYAVMVVAFVIGLYGLFSLMWLASDEVQHGARLVGCIL